MTGKRCSHAGARHESEGAGLSHHIGAYAAFIYYKEYKFLFVLA